MGRGTRLRKSPRLEDPGVSEQQILLETEAIEIDRTCLSRACQAPRGAACPTLGGLRLGVSRL